MHRQECAGGRDVPNFLYSYPLPVIGILSTMDSDLQPCDHQHQVYFVVFCDHKKRNHYISHYW